MLLLVFMAMAFSFLSREEDLREVPAIKKELDEARQENRTLRAQVQKLQRERAEIIADRDKLRAEVEDLKRQLNELLPDAPPPVASSGPKILVPEARFRWFQARVGSLEKSARELQLENGALRKQIGAKGGIGLPRCIVTSGFLLDLTLLPDGSVSGSPAWDEAAKPVASSLPGIQLLSSGQPLTHTQFVAAGNALNK